MIKETKDIEVTKITCLLKTGTSFICIVDANLPYIQRRTIDPTFGFPVDHLDEWSLFTLTTTIQPGTMHYRVDPCDVNEYLGVISNEKLLEKLLKDDSNILDKLNSQVEKLRNSKIETVLK